MRIAVCVVVVMACGHGKGGGGGPLGDGGSGTPCGGIKGPSSCADPNEFCDFRHDTCGGGDDEGVCTPRPTDCPDVLEPACGCDGQIRATPCEVNAAGFDVDSTGSCPPPSGEFACGFLICNLNSQFCVETPDDTGGPTSFVCRELPTECVNAGVTCACLQSAGESCAETCKGDATTGLVVACPGG